MTDGRAKTTDGAETPIENPAEPGTEPLAEDASARRQSGFRFWMAIPALAAAAIFSTFMIRLMDPSNPEDLPSMLIDKPAPQFSLPPLYDGHAGLSTADLRKPGVKLVNVFASWCVPCRVEAPELDRLAKSGVTIYGIDYKDDPKDAKALLDALGDPYEAVGRDDKGRVAIDWGVYGVPETFVLDGTGRIVYKHIGPIQNDDIRTRILPAIEAAKTRGGGTPTG